AEDEREGPRVSRSQDGPGARDGLDSPAPVGVRAWLELQFLEQPRADGRQEILFAANVRVERHPLDSEKRSQPAHADGVDAFSVGQRQGAIDDALSAEVPAPGS